MFNLKKVGQMAINRWMDTHRWWYIPTMSYYFAIRKGQTTTHETQVNLRNKMWCERSQRVVLYSSIIGNFRTQTKLTYGEMKQMCGCWGWRGRHRKEPLADLFLGWWENYLDWSGHISVCHFKWVHFMYVNSSSIKLIHEGGKGGHKYFNSPPWTSC